MYDEIENIEIIKWAFARGYDLGCNDMSEGIHIDFNETQQYFLDDLSKNYGDSNDQKSNENGVCSLVNVDART